MKCRLCGQPTQGQAKLCGDCGKALRRVRQGTAALRNLRMYSVRAEAPGAAAAAATEPNAQGQLAGRRRLAVVGAIALIAIALVYLGLRTPDYGRPPSAVVSDGSSPDSSPPRGEPTMLVKPSDSDESTAQPTAVESSAIPRPREAPSLATDPPQSLSPPARAKTEPRGIAATSTTPSNRGANLSRQKVAGDPVSRTSTMGTAVDNNAATEGVRLAVAAPAPPLDGALVLASALEKCSGERFLAGVVCEQKVRLQFCEGKWGQVPQCTARQRVD